MESVFHCQGCCYAPCHEAGGQPSPLQTLCCPSLGSHAPMLGSCAPDHQSHKECRSPGLMLQDFRAPRPAARGLTWPHAGCLTPQQAAQKKMQPRALPAEMPRQRLS